MTTPLNLTELGVALNGYDAVSYFSHAPVVGTSSIFVNYGGAIYYFANEENKAKFETDPEHFMPQYGGFCAVAVSEGKLVPVDPKTYKITDDKLYLFYNGEMGNTKPQWDADETNLRAKANARWINGDLITP